MLFRSSWWLACHKMASQAGSDDRRPSNNRRVSVAFCCNYSRITNEIERGWTPPAEVAGRHSSTTRKGSRQLTGSLAKMLELDNITCSRVAEPPVIWYANVTRAKSAIVASEDRSTESYIQKFVSHKNVKVEKTKNEKISLKNWMEAATQPQKLLTKQKFASCIFKESLGNWVLSFQTGLRYVKIYFSTLGIR